MPSKHYVYDFLVHPFYSLNRFSGSSKSVKVAELVVPISNEVVRQNSELMGKLWRERIEKIASDPDRGLVIVKAPVSHAFAKEFEQSLIRFAKLQLGDERCKVIPTPVPGSMERTLLLFAQHVKRMVDEGELKPKQGISGMAMGEWFDECVSQFSKIFSRVTGQKLTRSISRSLRFDPRKRGKYTSVFTRYHPRFFGNFRLPSHHAKTVTRLERFKKKFM